MKKTLSCLALFLGAAGAQAQETSAESGNSNSVETQITAEELPALKRNTVELRPVEVLLSAVPGVASVGASFESYVAKQWAAVVGVSYADIEISRENLDLAQDETDAPLVRSGYGYSAGLGVRYYEDPIGDSTYGGAHLDYSEVKADWEYEGENYSSTQYAVTPSLVVGYRWVWPNGVMARLGAGAGIPKVDSQSVELAPAMLQSSGDGIEEIEDVLDQQVVAKIDLGLGYSF